MFEKAAKLKLRFFTILGVLNVEDLYALNLEALDSIAITHRKELKLLEEVSFLKKENPKKERSKLKFDIVKHIIEVKLKEQEEAKQAKLRLDRKKQLLDVLANKEKESLSALSKEEILKELETL